MLSQEAIQKILGIGGVIPLEPEEMAKNLTMTTFTKLAEYSILLKIIISI